MIQTTTCVDKSKGNLWVYFLSCIIQYKWDEVIYGLGSFLDQDENLYRIRKVKEIELHLEFICIPSPAT